MCKSAPSAGWLRAAAALLLLLPVLAGCSNKVTPVSATVLAPVSTPWVATWSAAVLPMPNGASQAAQLGLPAPLGQGEMTLRQVVHTSLGGPRVRVRISNEFGTEPLAVRAVHLALSDGADAIQLSSAQRMTFAGADSVTLAPGAIATSDTAAMDLLPGSDIAISIDLPSQRLSSISAHPLAMTTGYAVPGNQVGQRTLSSPATIPSWLFLKSVDVLVPLEDRAVVAFGDSITDGAGGTLGTNTRWPDLLARRLQADPQGMRLAVANAGIGGNRLLHEGVGPTALARFDRDVLGVPGVRTVILLEGINDIGVGVGHQPVVDGVTLTQLIAAQTQLATRAHATGLRVLGATLTPYRPSGYSTVEGEAVRAGLNAWIRSYAGFDGVVDFDAALRDPATPEQMDPRFDSGDHLHPNDAGYRAMAEAVDLKLLIP